MNLPVLQPAIPCGNAGVTMNADNKTTATNTLFSFDTLNPPLSGSKFVSICPVSCTLMTHFLMWSSGASLDPSPRNDRPFLPPGAGEHTPAPTVQQLSIRWNRLPSAGFPRGSPMRLGCWAAYKKRQLEFTR